MFDLDDEYLERAEKAWLRIDAIEDEEEIEEDDFVPSLDAYGLSMKDFI